MTMATRIITVAAAAMLAAFPARAATTIYAASVYAQTNVTNAGSALFAVDGNAALISAGGELVLQYAYPLTGQNVAAALGALAPLPAFNFLSISVGEIIGGVATYSAGSIPFVDAGAGGVVNFDLAALCATVSATGCSLVRIQNLAAFGTPGALLDGVSGVTNAPEPAAWALMMLGFAGVGWRLKQARGRILGDAARRKRGSAFA